MLSGTGHINVRHMIYVGAMLIIIAVIKLGRHTIIINSGIDIESYKMVGNISILYN